MKRFPLVLAALLCLPGLALAQDGQSGGDEPPMPEWDQLTREQRLILIAPVRDQWNLNPKERARLFRHAERWQSMTQEEREQAEEGRRRFEQLTPEQRQRARALYRITRNWTEEERQRFNEKWQRLRAEQQDEWLRRHTPPRNDAHTHEEKRN